MRVKQLLCAYLLFQFLHFNSRLMDRKRWLEVFVALKFCAAFDFYLILNKFPAVLRMCVLAAEIKGFSMECYICFVD